jgi:endonuclease G
MQIKTLKLKTTMASKTNGYNKTVLAKALAFPKLDQSLCAPLKNGNGYEITYTHFSLFLHRERRLPYMTAVNIKGEAYSAPSREGNEPWDYSDQVAEEYQIDNDFYGHDENTFDRGHIVRRVDPCWGDQTTSDQAEQDTFKWVNCTPQHKKLNQKGGIWFQLEQHIIEHGVKNKLADVAVFAGPVLDIKDLPFKKKYHNTLVKVPIQFWKIIVWKKSTGQLNAVGFMMSQWEFIKDKLIKPVTPAAAKKPLADDYFENLKFNDHKTYQVSIKDIEKATGIQFNWTNVNFPYKAKPKAVRATPLKEVRPYAEVFGTKRRLVKTAAFKESTFKAELKNIAPVPKKKVASMVNKGEGYRLKRFRLSNITL